MIEELKIPAWTGKRSKVPPGLHILVAEETTFGFNRRRTYVGQRRRTVGPGWIDDLDYFECYDEDFTRLLFLHAHREASILAGEIPEESEHFRLLCIIVLA